MEEYNLKELNIYIDTFRNRCVQIQDRQTVMEKKFIRAVNSWSDNVYNKVNSALYDTAKYLKRVYDGIRDTACELSSKLTELAEEYIGIKTFNFRTSIPEFNISIKGVIEMPKETIRVDPQALIDFANELKEYVIETRTAIANIEREHSNMGAYWKGRHYDEFADVLQEVKTQIDRQLSLLETYNVYIARKHGILVDVIGTSINKMGH